MANKQTGGTRLTGQGSLNYLGVEPVSPPQLVRYQRQPTNRDFNFNLGDLWMVEDPTEVWMLADKPQNVANWILIYPQAGGAGGISIIVTPDGDVIANGSSEVFFSDGENTDVTRLDPNTLAYNLNRFIEWPATNAPGTEGVIYLDSQRFIHNYGPNGNVDGNSFYGINSGNFSLTGNSNTGIGFGGLFSLTTGDSNTSLGYTSLSSITTGSGNIGIGYQAGQFLNPISSNNICIGDVGDVGDVDKIRLGTQGLHTTAHVAGIYNTIVSGTPIPNTIVNVDDQGQLGNVELTSSGATIVITQPSNGIINLEAMGGGGGNPFAFSYVQVANTGNLPNNSTYNLGSAVVLTQLFDEGGNVYPGDGAGAPAVFTAPVTGKYYFEWYCGLDNFINSTITINTTKRNYAQENVASSQAPIFNLYTVVTDMDMGDTATFDIRTLYPALSPTRVRGNASPALINSTRISGFLIPEGASGGNFSQPFLGIQTVDAIGVIGTNANYYLGSSAILVEQYDIGNNFTGGDGVGTPAEFIVPETGIYSFTISTGVTAPLTDAILAIEVNGVIVQTSTFQGSSAGGYSVLGERQTYNWSLTIADSVKFIINSSNIGAPRDVIASVASSPSRPAQTNITFVSGYRIA